MFKYAMARRKKRKSNSSIKLFLTAVLGIFKRPIVLSWLFTVTCLVVLTAMSVPNLRAAHLSPAEVHVTFNAPPPWLDESLLVELQNIVRMHLAGAPVGREGVIRASDALMVSGWFTEIQQVRWTSNQDALVTASFLIPYAKIKDNRGTRFIDAFGKLLPDRNGLTVKGNYHFITFEYPRYDRPQRPGLQWNGQDILAGLSLLHLFYGNPWATEITSINLSRWDEQKTLLFETNTPSQFTWGSVPNQEKALEAVATQKIDRLNRAYSTGGRIDQGLSGNFDLTHPSIFLRK